MQKIRSLASKLATCDAAVLIVGEHGTGKRDLARHIHQQGPSARGPFLSVDCADTSAEHLADTMKQARGGTVFLANVGALDPDLQTVLWDILDGKELRRPDSPSGRADVRLIASVEPDLPPLTPDHPLAQLCRVSLFLPPLRERRPDIPILIRHLLDKLASSHDGPPRRFPDDTVVMLWQYDWPGNLRELEEVVRQSATSAADGVVYPGLLPVRIRASMKQGTPASLRAGDSFQEQRFLHNPRNSERKLSVLV
jgi:DNA-binding NtrC family response regulator